MDGCPLGLGLVVEDKPTEFSCLIAILHFLEHALHKKLYLGVILRSKVSPVFQSRLPTGYSCS